jgi:hypothetical protein
MPTNRRLLALRAVDAQRPRTFIITSIRSGLRIKGMRVLDIQMLLSILMEHKAIIRSDL